MNDSKYDILKLDNQLCFPLYAAARSVMGSYRPYLDELALTYTQYVAMMVIWEKESLNLKELGEKLFLDSGTLTPLLKNLEAKGYITRKRSTSDERVLLVTVTDAGKALKDRALEIPAQVASCVDLSQEEASQLYKLLYKLLDAYIEKK